MFPMPTLAAAPLPYFGSPLSQSTDTTFINFTYSSPRHGVSLRAMVYYQAAATFSI